jgi:hypothetical protein
MLPSMVLIWSDSAHMAKTRSSLESGRQEERMLMKGSALCECRPGRRLLQVTFERSHNVGDEWETSPSYSLTDPPALAEVADMGSEKVHALQQNPACDRIAG